MFDASSAAAPTPPPPPTRKRRTDGLALLLVGAVLGAVIGIGGARAVAPAIGRGTAPAGETGTTADEQAIKDVIQRANEAQAAAFAKNDPTAMKATSTDPHYQEMVKVNADLVSGGVRSIELVKLAYGEVIVNGSTATATTNETWRTTLRDGTVESSTDENDYSLVLQNGTWKIDSNTQPSSTGVTAPPQPQTPAGTTVRSTSRNWSGYVATGGTVTSVNGTWVVAKPDPTVAGVDATWVGIGGANTTDLIQAGTEATVNGDGTISYDAWTETLPQSTRTIALAVSGGDTVSVSITEQSAGLWLIEMKNVTTGRSFTTTLRYASSKSSAEWIEEAPSLGRGIAPLDSFGSVTFTAAGAVVDGKRESLSAANAKAVTMANAADQPLAVPSAIGTDGASFTVTRTSNPASNGSGGGPGRRRG